MQSDTAVSKRIYNKTPHKILRLIKKWREKKNTHPNNTIEKPSTKKKKKKKKGEKNSRLPQLSGLSVFQRLGYIVDLCEERGQLDALPPGPVPAQHLVVLGAQGAQLGQLHDDGGEEVLLRRVVAADLQTQGLYQAILDSLHPLGVRQGLAV